MSTPTLLSWSGGKDSALSLQALHRSGLYEVVALITNVTRGANRVSIHGVRRELLEAQAAAVALPLHVVELDPSSSNEAYELAFHDGLGRVRAHHPDVNYIAFGDLFLADVRAYRERALWGSPFSPIFPLWGEDTTRLARRFVDDGFEARLVCVDTTQLEATFAGRAFDHAMLDDLPTSADPCGERGEFHTFVANGPMFSAPIPYAVGGSTLHDARFLHCDLLAKPI